MASEGGKMDRREFLKRSTASIAAGITGFGLTNKVLGKFQKQNSTVPEVDRRPLSKEKIRELKNRNTTIELEKNILSSFDETDIENLRSNGKLPMDKIFQFTKGYHNAMVAAAGTTVVTAGALGATGLLMKNQRDKSKAPQLMGAGVGQETISDDAKIALAAGASFLGALVSGFALNNMVYNQPSLQNVASAEGNVQEWLHKLRSDEKFHATRDSFMSARGEYIEALNTEQGNNSKMLTQRFIN
ncbi:MAG: hypothetical protein Q8Q13_02870 [bacterium]|nr:hypothetical protein [bacterium]